MATSYIMSGQSYGGQFQMPQSFSQPAVTSMSSAGLLAQPMGITNAFAAPASFAPQYTMAPQVTTMAPAGLLAPQFTTVAPQYEVVAGPQMVQMVPQPVAVEYEIRELSEDRIIRRPAIYKDSGAPAPVYERQIEYVDAAPAEEVMYLDPSADEAVRVVEALQDKRVDPADNKAVSFNDLAEKYKGVYDIDSDILPGPEMQAYFENTCLPQVEDVGVVQALLQTLGPLTRLCILGGQKFNDESSEPLVKALADAVSAYLSDRVVVITGGMSGVQETFANGCAAGPAVVNMLPAGQASNFAVGTDFAAFRDLNERIAVFGQIGDIYISIEGGPGVSKESNAAFARDAIVLPMMSTGGASSGLMGFPAGALEVPQFASPEEWELLKTKGNPEETARTVCEMILRLIPQPQ